MTRHLLYAVKFTAADGKPDLVKVKLSAAQKAFLLGFARHGYSLAPDGRINASAWHRTCDSLVDMGLVTKTSHHAAGLTWLGLAWAVVL